MERANRQRKKIINKDQVIKKRIEMLLTACSVGLVLGIIIGILLPIGGIKKSEYNKLKEDNKKIQSQLSKANTEIDKLNKEIEKNTVFSNLEESQKEHVINYISSLDNNEVESNNADTKIITTDMYNTFYKEYSYSLGYLSYNDFKTILETFDYKANVVEEENKYKIKFNDENRKDNVILTFSDINNDSNPVLINIRYVRENKYIEVDYDKDDSSTKYITSEGDNQSIKNINDQARYLFTQ